MRLDLVNPDGPEAADEIARLTAEVEELRERVDGAEASAMNCGDCYDKDVKIDRLQAVVDAAEEVVKMNVVTYRLRDALRALDGEP